MNLLINCLRMFVMILFVGCGGVNAILTVNLGLASEWAIMDNPDGSVQGVPYGAVYNNGFYYRVEPMQVTSLPVLSYDSKVDGGSKALAIVFPENVICGENLIEIEHGDFKIRDELKLCKILYTPVGMTYYDMLGYREWILPSLISDFETNEIIENNDTMNGVNL